MLLQVGWRKIFQQECRNFSAQAIEPHFRGTRRGQEPPESRLKIQQGRAAYIQIFDPGSQGRGRVREGDSWTEELEFSKKEIATAWKNIGVHCPSKAAFDAVPPTQRIDGPEWKVMPYARYFDRLRKKTFYVRNDQWFDPLASMQTARFFPPSSFLPEVPLLC